MDPRQRGLFGAAWTLAYIATLARAGAAAVTVGAPTGPLGVIYRKTDYAQPHFDDIGSSAVYPAYHVVSGLARASGSKLVSATSSDAAKVECLAVRGKGGTILWLANRTADSQSVKLSGAAGTTFAAVLDEDSFAVATTDPAKFQRSWKAVGAAGLKLGAYAVAVVSIND